MFSNFGKTKLKSIKKILDKAKYDVSENTPISFSVILDF